MRKKQDENSVNVVEKEVKKKLTPKKKSNLKILELMIDKLSEVGFGRFKECATFNMYITTESKDKMKNVKSNRCKNRFCSICAWVRAKKDASLISVLMEALAVRENAQFLFLTLTTPNVTAENLKLEIDRFNKSFEKMFKRKDIKNAVNGYVRKLEITYNKKSKTYNPHFHVILAVDKSYFKNTRKYLTQKDWLVNWRECTGFDGINEDGTDEIVALNIKKIQYRDGAVREVAKYSAKDFEMGESQEIFDVFYSALKGRQLLVFGGKFKEYKKLFDEGDLDEFKRLDENEYYYKVFAEWEETGKGKYVVHRWKMLSEKERIEYNGKKVDEVEMT